MRSILEVGSEQWRKHVEKAQLTEHLFGRYDFFCVSGRERRKLRLRISKRVLSPESDIPDTQRYKCNDILAKKLRFPQQGSGSRKKMPEFENIFYQKKTGYKEDKNLDFQALWFSVPASRVLPCCSESTILLFLIQKDTSVDLSPDG